MCDVPRRFAVSSIFFYEGVMNRIAAKISQTKKAGEMRRPRFEMQG